MLQCIVSPETVSVIDPPKGPAVSIVAVERALVILKLMARSPDGVSVRGVGRELGYSPAVVQKILQALLLQGFAEQDPVTQTYQLGPVALQVGLSGLAKMEVRELSRPYLERLAEATGETSLLAIRQRNMAIYIDQVPSRHEVRLNVALGDPRPFNCTAVGKALLAFQDDNELARLLEEGAIESRTPHSITEPDKLRKVLEDVRATDVALDEEEFILGARCIATPIRNHGGQVIAALAVAGPAERMRLANDVIVREVKATAAAVSGALGLPSDSASSLSA